MKMRGQLVTIRRSTSLEMMGGGSLGGLDRRRLARIRCRISNVLLGSV